MVLQLSQVVLESSQLLGVSLVVGLVLKEVQAFVGESECSEQERLDWVLEVPVLSLLAVLVHDISDDGEVDGVGATILLGLGFGLLDELVTLAVSMGEADHHHAMDDLLSLVLVQTTALLEHLLAQDVVDEVSHHYVHVGFAGCGEATVLHGLLPSHEVALLKSEELVSVELVELIFEELGHDSEARSIEEEVELLVILFSSGVGGTDL